MGAYPLKTGSKLTVFAVRANSPTTVLLGDWAYHDSQV